MNAILPQPLLAVLGTTEIVIIALVVVILFGARKIPDLMKGVVSGKRVVNRGCRDVEKKIKPS